MFRLFPAMILLLANLAHAQFLEPLPTWARDSLYSGHYLDIQQVMKNEKLSFAQAVEVQNQTRDLLDNNSSLPPLTAYSQALKSVRSGVVESGWQPITFTNPADFIAVLDLDETLLVQWYDGQNNFDLDNVMADWHFDRSGQQVFSGTYVKFTPGAEQFMRQLKTMKNCKGIVFFSAKADGPVWDIVNKWKFADGTPVRSFISGVFTRNYLVVGPNPTTLIPSKDLRIFDPELKNVVMIDDNPGRLVQPLNLLAQPKFDAEQLALAQREQRLEVVRHYTEALENSRLTLVESVRGVQGLRTFADSFRPHSYFGERITKNQRQTLVREYPEWTIDRIVSESLRITRENPFLHTAIFRPALADPDGNPLTYE